MISFREWRLREVLGPTSPSMVDDEGDGLERVLKNNPHPALDVLNPKERPPTRQERAKPIFSKKK